MEFEKDKPTFFVRIKPVLIFIGFVLSICLGIYGSVMFHTPIGDKITSIPQLAFVKNLPMPEIDPGFDLLIFLNDVVENGKAKLISKITGKEPLLTKTSETKNKKTKSRPNKPKKKEADRKVNPDKLVTLHLKNGSSISGELIGESKRAYVLYWQGGQVTFAANEVISVERKKTLKDPNAVEIKFSDAMPALGVWPYQNDIVIRMNKGSVVDQPISAVSKNQITVQERLEGGGSIEQDIDRSKIEYLMFRPVESSENKAIEENLKKQFPKMKFYQEGNFTIVTDSYETWVREYKKIMHQNYTDVYLNFFPILKEHKQSVQNYIVVFDSYVSFVEYAVADGVPGWMVLGYFRPDDKVLYLFNTLGDEFSEELKYAISDQPEKYIDQAAERMKQAAGERYSAFIEGQATDIKAKFWRYHDWLRGIYRKITTDTLRHESTHQILGTWGVQSIVVSGVGKDEKAKQELIEKKKKFLESKDIESKRKLLKQLILMRKDEKLPEMNAANSWYVEGVATYCATNPPGEGEEQWLFYVQKMIRENTLLPTEQLTVYKMGSFPGVYPDAMINAYAQSWAFVTFLMYEYPDQFLQYLKRVSVHTPKDNEDFQWLVEALGKDIRSVESEFVEFMKKYEPVEDPDVKHINKILEIFTSF